LSLDTANLVADVLIGALLLVDMRRCQKLKQRVTEIERAIWPSRFKEES
jgi:hypothetical protein